jgi:biopolymer transport protein ExbD
MPVTEGPNMAERLEPLSAAQRSRVRRATTPRELSPDEEGGELNVVPFLDIITNVLMFVLATVSVTFTTTIMTRPPRAPVRLPTKPSLALNVVAIDGGFIVSAFGQRIGEKCEGTGAGVTVGRAGKDYDYGGLTACAARLKNQLPEAAEETSATVTASSDIPYEVVIGTVDAIRKADDGRELFPDITFGVPK